MHGWRPERVRVGTVGKPHGLDGAFRVAGPCGWFAFAKGAPLLLDGAEARILRRAGTDDDPIVVVDLLPDRTATEARRGARLEVPRAALPEPDPDSYFHFDLVGCRVEEPDGRSLGTVSAVEEGVAHDVLVLDDAAQTRLPFVAAVVPEVDIPGRRLGVIAGFVREAAP